MILSGTRFGEIEVEDAKVVSFARGLVGFPDARRFVLLEPAEGRSIAWLQSLDTPELAFPVVDAAHFAGYPQPGAGELAREANLGTEELTVLVVVAVAAGKGLVANMLAPIVVDLESKSGAQTVLDPRRYSAAAPVAVA